MRSAWLGLLLLIGLAGCSRAHVYRFDAQVIDGEVAFVPSVRQGACLWRFEVVDDLGQLVWAADRAAPAQPPEVSGAPLRCDDGVPVRYGAAPQGMVTRAPPLPLRAGRIYEIRGFGGGSFRGRFRYGEGPAVENLKPYSSGR
jgi:hypothetical protein